MTSTALAAPTLRTYSLKFTASEIKNNCPPAVRELGEEIAWNLSRANALTDKTYECVKKVEEHITTALRLSVQAQELCDEGGFVAFKEKFCPSLGRSRAYELLAIATGKKSIADTRASNRDRQARHRAKQAESVTRHGPGLLVSAVVTDSAPPEPASSTDNSLEDISSPVKVTSTDNSFEDISSPVGKAKVTSTDNSLEDTHNHYDAAVRDRVLVEYFSTATGTSILNYIMYVTKREDVIAEILDDLTVEKMLMLMSSEFGQKLRAAQPTNPIIKLREMDAATAASAVYEAFGPGQSATIIKKLQNLITPNATKAAA